MDEKLIKLRAQKELTALINEKMIEEKRMNRIQGKITKMKTRIYELEIYLARGEVIG